MAHKTVTRVSKAGGAFATWQEALAAFKVALSARETASGASIKTSTAGIPEVTRTLSLLEDGSGFEIVDTWASQEAMDAHFTSVRQSYVAAGWEQGTLGNGFDGWTRTVVSSESV